MKDYFQITAIPLVGMLTAKKTLVQNDIHFYLNESFASWLIMIMFGGLSSTMQWYQVVFINLGCFILYITIVFHHYGVEGVGKDFYIHITTAFIGSACLIRMNELNQRNSYNLLSHS